METLNKRIYRILSWLIIFSVILLISWIIGFNIWSNYAFNNFESIYESRYEVIDMGIDEACENLGGSNEETTYFNKIEEICQRK